MTTVATRVRHISDLEGFDIIVTKENEPVDVKSNGVLEKNIRSKKCLKAQKESPNGAPKDLKKHIESTLVMS